VCVCVNEDIKQKQFSEVAFLAKHTDIRRLIRTYSSIWIKVLENFFA